MASVNLVTISWFSCKEICIDIQQILTALSVQVLNFNDGCRSGFKKPRLLVFLNLKNLKKSEFYLVFLSPDNSPDEASPAGWLGLQGLRTVKCPIDIRQMTVFAAWCYKT